MELAGLWGLHCRIGQRATTGSTILRSPDVPDDAGPLTYFTHEVDGRLRVGWWRRLKGRRIEVFTRSRVQIAFLESDSPETTAQRVLEELTRGEES
jgi:hypothetical protein